MLPERSAILLLLIDDSFILNSFGSFGKLKSRPGLIQSKHVRIDVADDDCFRVTTQAVLQ
jgi:hypothetical protein